MATKRTAEVAAPTATGASTVLAIYLFGKLFPDVTIDAETAGAITLVITLITGPIWARIKDLMGWGAYKAALVLLCAGMLATGCITVTTTAPDGTVTKTQQLDMAAIATMPGVIGDLGVELARIDAALDNVNEDAPPTAEELARRERREAILNRLLELGIEVIEQNADTAKG